MKKLVIPFLLALCLFNEANAQLKKSNFLLSGYGAYSNSKQENENVYSNHRNYFSLGPIVGFFITDKLVLGVDARYSITSVTTENIYSSTSGNTTKIKEHGFDLGPFIRYYAPINDKFAFFAHANFMMGKSKNKNTYTSNNSGIISITENNTDYNNYRVGISPGITFFPSDKVGIELMFGQIAYNQYKTKFNNTSPNYKSNGFDIGLNLQSFNLAVSFYL